MYKLNTPADGEATLITAVPGTLKPLGSLIIPPTITNNSIVYNVVEISPLALEGVQLQNVLINAKITKTINITSFNPATWVMIQYSLDEGETDDFIINGAVSTGAIPNMINPFVTDSETFVFDTTVIGNLQNQGRVTIKNNPPVGVYMFTVSDQTGKATLKFNINILSNMVFTQISSDNILYQQNAPGMSVEGGLAVIGNSFPDPALKTIKIPYSLSLKGSELYVTSIMDGAFNTLPANVQTIELPSSIVQIGSQSLNPKSPTAYLISIEMDSNDMNRSIHIPTADGKPLKQVINAPPGVQIDLDHNMITFSVNKIGMYQSMVVLDSNNNQLRFVVIATSRFTPVPVTLKTKTKFVDPWARYRRIVMIMTILTLILIGVLAYRTTFMD